MFSLSDEPRVSCLPWSHLCLPTQVRWSDLQTGTHVPSFQVAGVFPTNCFSVTRAVKELTEADDGRRPVAPQQCWFSAALAAVVGASRDLVSMRAIRTP